MVRERPRNTRLAGARRSVEEIPAVPRLAQPVVGLLALEEPAEVSDQVLELPSLQDHAIQDAGREITAAAPLAAPPSRDQQRWCAGLRVLRLQQPIDHRDHRIPAGGVRRGEHDLLQVPAPVLRQLLPATRDIIAGDLHLDAVPVDRHVLLALAVVPQPDRRHLPLLADSQRPVIGPVPVTAGARDQRLPVPLRHPRQHPVMQIRVHVVHARDRDREILPLAGPRHTPPHRRRRELPCGHQRQRLPPTPAAIVAERLQMRMAQTLHRCLAGVLHARLRRALPDVTSRWPSGNSTPTLFIRPRAHTRHHWPFRPWRSHLYTYGQITPGPLGGAQRRDPARKHPERSPARSRSGSLSPRHHREAHESRPLSLG